MEKTLQRVNIIFLIALILSVIISLFASHRRTSETMSEFAGDNGQRIHIMIDPGHGGIDPGTAGSLGKAEAPINLDISQKLMTILEGSGFIVEMTRYDDEGLYTEKSATVREKKNEDLTKRVELINAAASDLTVSIHLNSFPQQQYYGAHVFYSKNSEESKTAADIIQAAMKEILDKNNNRVPQVKRDIRIMDYAEFPIVLIECGFLSNPGEEALLVSDEYQEKVAWSIYAGILQYFSSKDSAPPSQPINDESGGTD